MPLTAEQKTALDALKGADPAELADAFHETHGKAAQVLIDQGDAGATKRAGADLRKAEKDLKAEQDQHAATKAKLAESDPAKVHAQYQGEIKTLIEKHDGEVKALKEQGRQRSGALDLSQLEARLGKRLKPMAVRALLNDPKVKDLLQYDDAGQRTGVTQFGKQVPYAAREGQDALDLLADDLVEHVKGIDADSVLAQAAPGGGTGDGGGGGAGSYDAVKAGKDAAKVQKGEGANKDLALR